MEDFKEWRKNPLTEIFIKRLDEVIIQTKMNSYKIQEFNAFLMEKGHIQGLEASRMLIDELTEKEGKSRG